MKKFILLSIWPCIWMEVTPSQGCIHRRPLQRWALRVGVGWPGPQVLRLQNCRCDGNVQFERVSSCGIDSFEREGNKHRPFDATTPSRPISTKTSPLRTGMHLKTICSPRVTKYYKHQLVSMQHTQCKCAQCKTTHLLHVLNETLHVLARCSKRQARHGTRSLCY